MPKRTYNPSKRKRSQQGFLTRSRNSKNVLRARRGKGRKRLTPTN